jgi:hypothetical protein
VERVKTLFDDQRMFSSSGARPGAPRTYLPNEHTVITRAALQKFAASRGHALAFLA